MKKKTLVPLIVFLLGICLVSFIVYKTDTHEREQRHITAQLNAATYGERIKNEITDGIEITNALGQILEMKLVRLILSTIKTVERFPATQETTIQSLRRVPSN